MSFVADPHNFGKQVSRVEGVFGSFFQKPRPLFWEWLFFGKNSPLIPLLLSSGSSSAEKIVSSLFNLDVDLQSERSREIVGADEFEAPTPDELFKFGALIAYCYTFGILDLHEFNVVRTKTHLQVVDAEVVLCDILLPNQTLLLPFKETTFERSAIRHFFRDQESVTTGDVVNILRGFTQCIDILLTLSPQIATAFPKILAGSPMPVRIILRNTKLYRGSPEVLSDTSYFTEELEQLNRGDVPYFFKHIGDPRLYYYTSPTGDYSSAPIPARFTDTVDKTAVDPTSLVNNERLKKHILPAGILYIANKFLPSGYVGDFSLSAHAKLSVSTSTLTLHAPEETFCSERAHQ
jgi:hypothetical protein